MSWLRDVGGGISSITNQLTNFTKEVISEGREEVSDHVTELSLSQHRTRELEIQCNSQKKEVERLQFANKELEERIFAAELQTISITKEYRSQLGQKEDEVRRLQEEQELLVQSKKSNLGSPGYQSSSCAAFADMDEMEFADVISSQHEINRLSDTVHRLRAERDHWKRRATSAQISTGELVPDDGIQQLEVKNKELEKRLNETVDEHQKELSALQDAYEEKMQCIRRNIQSDVAQQALSDDEASNSQLQRLNALKSRLEKVESEKHEFRRNEIEAQEKIEKLQAELKCARDEDLQRKLEEAESKICELLRQHDQASNSELLKEVGLARQKLTSESKEVQLLEERENVANKLAAINAQSDDTRGNVGAAEVERENWAVQMTLLIDKLGDEEHQQLIAGIFHALELENEVLKDQNIVLHKQIVDQQANRGNKKSSDGERRMSPSHSFSRSASVERSEDGTQQYEFEEFDNSSVISSYSELSQKNKELDEQLKTLQSQIEIHERDIEHFEMVKADWQTEKQTFGQLLDKMKNQLRAKESSFTVVTAQKGLLELKKQTPRIQQREAPEDETGDLNLESELEKLQEQIEELSRCSVEVENERDLLRIEKDAILDELIKANKLNENLKTESSQHETQKLLETVHEMQQSISSLTTERQTLNTSLDELDRQHQTAIELILQSRNDVQSKLQTAQSQLDKMDRNMSELEEEKSALASELEIVKSSKSELELALETLQSSKDEKTRSDWETESWEDIADDKNNGGARDNNNLMKSTTKLQDLELESTSSKHSKDSSDDGHTDKYGELVQRKEDLEMQIKDLESQINDLTAKKSSAEENEKLRAELNSALGRVDELTKQAEDAEKQLSATNDILKVYKESIDVEKVDESVTKLKNDLKLKETEISNLKSELSKTEKGEIWWSEDEYRNLQHEREQILSVLNEKSRENSSLKGDVHRLTSIVSAERSALDKLQQDTRQLLAERENAQESARQMTTKAVEGLSRMVRDKELEIEALRQKNDTLITILNQSQSTSDSNGQLEALLTERGNLTQQMGVLKAEREEIIRALTQKHEESVAYHAEIQRISSALNAEHDRFTNLELRHSAVAKQYEDKQKSLIDTQNELVCSKQRVAESEQQHLELKGKYAAVLERAQSGESVEISRTELKTMEDELCNLRKCSADKDEWLFEKDKLMRELQQRIERGVEELKRRDEDVGSGKRHVESLNTQILSLRNELESNLKVKDEERERVENATSETNVLKETNSRLCLVVQEREFEISALKEKVVTLTKVVEERDGSGARNPEEMKGLLEESEAMRLRAQEFQQERDQALMGVNQKQQENKQLVNELQSLRDRELKLHHELDRLRIHLLQVEESYTQEAIHAEDREKELRNRLTATEDRIRNAASSYTNASFQANIQVDSLQQQLHVIAQQRDEALLKLDKSEDQTQQLAASLQTFQVVLEQFQREKERDLSVLKSQHENKLKQEQRARQQLEYQIQSLEHKLEEAKEALAAASRLSEILDQRNEDIASLKREVSDRDGSLKKIQEEMRRVASSTEGKVDRSIIKNLLVNYLSIPIRQQPEVLKIMATVLDFSYEDRVKAGLETTGGWMSNWLGQKPAQMTGAKQRSSTNSVPSLSAAFIQFLETESRPTFAIKSMAQEITRKSSEHGKVVNPFAATNISPLVGEADSSHLLMKPMTATLPVFTPLPVSGSAPSFLRDVLKDD